MENSSLKPFSTILIEAVVVGVGLVIVYNITDAFMKYMKLTTQQYVILFLAGFVFHVLAEYSGVNLWYAKQYAKLF
jgi:H+/gluconate symporter-like permease